jgi:hypothetical protein
VYKALDERSAALRHFTIAMNLDPKVRVCDCETGILLTATGDESDQRVAGGAGEELRRR